MILRISINRLYFLGIVACIVLLLFLHLSTKGAKNGLCELPPKIHLVLAEPEDRCIEHHIVIVVGGYTTAYNALPLFKSILYHHRGPLVFHFITDAESRQVLPTMFDTWKLSSVRYRIYDMDPYRKLVDWVPNKHYSAIYGLIRLAIPDMLPVDVKEVLFLDTDLIVLNDITPIFNAFKGTNDSVLLAMAQNISPGYTWGKNKWPARGRGYNAGVSLLHLERMRRANFTEMWTKEARERFEKDVKKGNDQDIINALTVSHPHIAVELPCEYNYQLGSHSTPLGCQKSDRFVKIAHFNSPEKMRLKSKYVVHFAHYHSIYQAMDGYSFRQRERCDAESEASLTLADLVETDRECDELSRAIQTTYRTQLYLNGFKASTDAGDITLVTHLSVDQFDALKSVLNSWKGPISAAIYCTDAELSLLDKLIRFGIDRQRTNVAVHAVFKTGNYYPANYLRNVALNASRSEFVYLTEFDFIPSKDLYVNFRSAMGSTNMTKKALLVPAFKLASYSNGEPSTREELMMAWDNRTVFLFEDHIDQRNLSIHEQWRISKAPFEVDHLLGFKASVIVSKHEVPLYEERLIGSEWNDDVQWSRMNDERFRFEMVPGTFTIHHSHRSSTISNSASNLYRKCIHIFREEFASDTKFEKLILHAIL